MSNSVVNKLKQRMGIKAIQYSISKLETKIELIIGEKFKSN